MIYTQELVEAARQFAQEKHEGQLYGTDPYMEHLRQVYELAVYFNLPMEYHVAAWLHDCIEDTSATFEEIEERFGTHIAKMVDAVSGHGENRKARTQDTINKLNHYPSAINLKMIDRLANSRNSKIHKPKLYVTYQKEHTLFEALFKQGNSLIFAQLEYSLETTPKSRLRM